MFSKVHTRIQAENVIHITTPNYQYVIHGLSPNNCSQLRKAAIIFAHISSLMLLAEQVINFDKFQIQYSQTNLKYGKTLSFRYRFCHKFLAQ